MPTEARIARMWQAANGRQQGIVVFEDIHDPHNAEAVLRTCDAFGFHYAWFVFESEEPFDPRRVGKATSASANKWLEYRVLFSMEQCLRDLRAEGYEVVATTPNEPSEPLFEAQFSAARLAVLFGNEHRGLSEVALAGADRRVMVPMAGMVRSLNLSVTAALVLYEITRQRRLAGMERYRLPPEERARIVGRWLARESG